MYQSEVLKQRLDTRDELGFEMRWCWWRYWWRLTPSRWEDRWWWRRWWFPPPGGKFPRQNSSAGALVGSAKVLPRGSGVSSRELAYDFFQGKRPHIEEDGHRRPSRGPTSQGACPPPSWMAGGPLWYFFRPIFFIYSENNSRGVSGLLEMCRIGL